MATSVSANNLWWMITLEGVAALLFGIAAIFWPGLTLVALVYIFSAYVLISGIVNMVMGIVTMGSSSWFFRLIVGLVELGVGVYLVRHPGVTAATLILLIGFMLIFRGVFGAVASFSDDEGNKTLGVVGGVLAVLAGIIVLMNPAAGGVAFVWVLGLYGLITGPLLIVVGMETKHLMEA
ncbi:MAG TPA: DUF308 domain-containing protein [Candidatus Saccharimonadales bacterium]|nr:DUF308 domain-containing protein [Candidatus Saccharimonadales bacterium]